MAVSDLRTWLMAFAVLAAPILTPGVAAAHAALVQRLPDQKAVSAARIYGGIHFRTSNMAGQVMGRKIAELSVNNYLKPIH